MMTCKTWLLKYKTNSSNCVLVFFFKNYRPKKKSSKMSKKAETLLLVDKDFGRFRTTILKDKILDTNRYKSINNSFIFKESPMSWEVAKKHSKDSWNRIFSVTSCVSKTVNHGPSFREWGRNLWLHFLTLYRAGRIFQPSVCYSNWMLKNKKNRHRFLLQHSIRRTHRKFHCNSHLRKKEVTPFGSYSF